MPRTAWVWIVAAAAIVGVPLTNGFVAKWLLLEAGLDAGVNGAGVMPMVVVIVAWLVSTFTAFYILKATVSVFFGDTPDGLRGRPIEEAAASMQIGMGVLGACCVIFGIAPQILINWVVLPAARALGFAGAPQISWLGVRASGAATGIGLSALIVLVALFGGATLYLATRPARAGTTQVFSGGEPLPAGNTVGAVDFAEMAETSFAPVYRAADPDPLYLAVWHWLNRGAEWLSAALASAEARPLAPVIVLAVVAAVVLMLI
jgi:multicomponent Na+:H+ antiporter subunit A